MEIGPQQGFHTKGQAEGTKMRKGKANVDIQEKALSSSAKKPDSRSRCVRVPWMGPQ